MKITEIKSSPEKPNPNNINVRMLYDTKYAQAAHIELKPGKALKKHITPVDVFFYILEGKKASLRLATRNRKLAKIC